MGRFLSLDPILGRLSEPQSLNRYAYVRNNPLNRVDPSGLGEGGATLGFDRTRGQYSGPACGTHAWGVAACEYAPYVLVAIAALAIFVALPAAIAAGGGTASAGAFAAVWGKLATGGAVEAGLYAGLS